VFTHFEPKGFSLCAGREGLIPTALDVLKVASGQNKLRVVHSLFCLKRRVRLSEEQHRTQGWNEGDELKSESRPHRSTLPIYSTMRCAVFCVQRRPLPAIWKQQYCWYSFTFVFHRALFSFTLLKGPLTWGYFIIL